MNLKYILSIALLTLAPFAFANDGAIAEPTPSNPLLGTWAVEADFYCNGQTDFNTYTLDVTENSCRWIRPDGRGSFCRVSGNARNFRITFMNFNGDISGQVSRQGNRFQGRYFAPGQQSACVHGFRRN